MTYNVFDGTLNLALSIYFPIYFPHRLTALRGRVLNLLLSAVF